MKEMAFMMFIMQRDKKEKKTKEKKRRLRKKRSREDVCEDEEMERNEWTWGTRARLFKHNERRHDTPS